MAATRATLPNTKVSSLDLIAPLNKGISGTSGHFAACTVSYNRALNLPEKGHKREESFSGRAISEQNLNWFHITYNFSAWRNFKQLGPLISVWTLKSWILKSSPITFHLSSDCHQEVYGFCNSICILWLICPSAYSCSNSKCKEISLLKRHADVDTKPSSEGIWNAAHE